MEKAEEPKSRRPNSQTPQLARGLIDPRQVGAVLIFCRPWHGNPTRALFKALTQFEAWLNPRATKPRIYLVP